MPVTNIFEWQCDFCPARRAEPVQQNTVYGHAILTNVGIPVRWRWVGDKLACDEHKIKVDGKEV